MIKLLTLAFSLCFLLPTIAQQKKKGPKVPESARAIKNIEYSNVNGNPLLLDLYVPKQYSGKTPVIMWVHGGGWKNGSKERGKVSMAC